MRAKEIYRQKKIILPWAYFLYLTRNYQKMSEKLPENELEMTEK
jgi:hypothetical protein